MHVGIDQTIPRRKRQGGDIIDGSPYNRNAVHHPKVSDGHRALGQFPVHVDTCINRPEEVHHNGSILSRSTTMKVCHPDPHAIENPEIKLRLREGLIKIDTVGELGSLENCVSRMPSLKAQDNGNAYAERLALEGRKLFANSIPSFSKTVYKCLFNKQKSSTVQNFSRAIGKP